jgi:hypothetical protein
LKFFSLAAPIGNCRLIRYIDFLYPFSIPFSILPFIPRVAAVYHNSKYVIAFFTLTWAVVLASSILWPFGVIGQQLGPTDYCVEMKLASTAAISALCLFIHDTLIFLATSWAFVLQSYMDDSVKGVLKSIVLGKNLSGFTRSFLRDGQAYYMWVSVLPVYDSKNHSERSTKDKPPRPPFGPYTILHCVTFRFPLFPWKSLPCVAYLYVSIRLSEYPPRILQGLHDDVHDFAPTRSVHRVCEGSRFPIL